jgi:hypothetical protein
MTGGDVTVTWRQGKRDGGGMVIARTERERGRSTHDARGGAQQGVQTWSVGVSAAERKAFRS